MTVEKAIRALFEEYHLEEHVEMVRDDVRGDPAHDGLSKDHPKVKRFEEICQTLKTSIGL